MQQLVDNATIAHRNNVRVLGRGSKTLVLAHGFGCDQTMWRFVIPGLEDDYRIVLFDYVGSGRSDPSAYSVERYSSLSGYAQDINEICEELDLRDVSLVGHSVSGSIGLIAAMADPERFSDHRLLCPSPSFLNHPPDYHGGFEREDLVELLDLMDKNYIGWADCLATLVIGTASSEDLIRELSGSMCSTDPVIARTFAEATFFSDCRDLLPDVRHPALIIQSATDSLAPPSVGAYMQRHLPHGRLRVIDAEGHCPHMTHPHEVLPALRERVDP